VKGKVFGPRHQFRIDLDTLADGRIQATGFDVGKPGHEVAMPLVTVVREDREIALRECRQQVKSSPEWVKAARERLMDKAQQIQIVEKSLQRELEHLGKRIEWNHPGIAQKVYANIMDTRLVTSPEIKRLQAAATEKMKQTGLLETT